MPENTNNVVNGVNFGGTTPVTPDIGSSLPTTNNGISGLNLRSAVIGGGACAAAGGLVVYLAPKVWRGCKKVAGAIGGLFNKEKTERVDGDVVEDGDYEEFDDNEKTDNKKGKKGN